VATILMIFLKLNCPNFKLTASGYVKRVLKMHSLTFKDAQINFDDKQFV